MQTHLPGYQNSHLNVSQHVVFSWLNPDSSWMLIRNIHKHAGKLVGVLYIPPTASLMLHKNNTVTFIFVALKLCRSERG